MSKLPDLTKRVVRPRLTEKMVNNLLARRYGSLHDFSKVVARWCDISKATGINPNTIRKALQTYHRRGHRFLKCNATNFRMGRPCVLPRDVEAQLVSRETLYSMRFLPIQRRVELVNNQHGTHLSVEGFTNLYKRNKVKYLQSSKAKRLTPSH